MSDPNRIIETRPTVSMDFSESTFETPPSEVVFFDSMALAHHDIMKRQLEAWPPEQPPKPHDQPAYDVHTAITGILEGSRSGRTIDYDNGTWFDITNNEAYEAEAAKMQASGRANKAIDPQREKVAVLGLGIYIDRLHAFNAANGTNQNVA